MSYRTTKQPQDRFHKLPNCLSFVYANIWTSSTLYCFNFFFRQIFTPLFFYDLTFMMTNYPGMPFDAEAAASTAEVPSK